MLGRDGTLDLEILDALSRRGPGIQMHQPMGRVIRFYHHVRNGDYETVHMEITDYKPVHVAL